MDSPRTDHRSSDSLKDYTEDPFESIALSVPSALHMAADDRPFAGRRAADVYRGSSMSSPPWRKPRRREASPPRMPRIKTRRLLKKINLFKIILFHNAGHINIYKINIHYKDYYFKYERNKFFFFNANSKFDKTLIFLAIIQVSEK